MDPNNKTSTIEEDIKRKLDQLDHRFDRNGWFFLVLLMLILFLLIYLFMNVFRVPETDTYQSNTAIMEEIKILEERIESLELEVKDIKPE